MIHENTWNRCLLHGLGNIFNTMGPFIYYVSILNRNIFTNFLIIFLSKQAWKFCQTVISKKKFFYSDEKIQFFLKNLEVKLSFVL